MSIKSEWISVNDRLPSSDELGLGGIYTNERPVIGLIEYESDPLEAEGDFSHCDDYYPEFVSFDPSDGWHRIEGDELVQVHYWLPIPEIPKYEL